MLRRSVVPLALALFTVAACSKNEPPPEPTPVETTAPPPARPAAPDTAGDGARRAAAEAERLAAEADSRARATLADMIFFSYDESSLSADARATLDAKVAILRANPGVRIQVAGHADERGSLEYNVALGMRRALAAKEYLAGFGIDGSRIEVTSFGEERPMAMGSNESAWAQNRRDEFTVVAGPQRLVAPGS